MSREVICEKCNTKCEIGDGGVSELCGNCKWENFVNILEAPSLHERLNMIEERLTKLEN